MAKVTLIALATSCGVIGAMRFDASTDQRINGSTDQLETVSALQELDFAPKDFVYLRLPSCGSCTQVGFNAMDKLAKNPTSRVVVALDLQPDEVVAYAKRIKTALFVEWKDLPRDWRAIQPGIYDCSQAAAKCVGRKQ